MTDLCRLNHPHNHGGSNCYDTGKCRCRPCRDGNSSRTRRIRRLKAYGQWESQVDPTGTIRRIRGLQVLGFTMDQIGAAAGFNRNTVWRIQREKWIEVPTRDRIDAAYRELMRNPTEGKSRRTANSAKAKGWLSPFAWDDIDSDAEPVNTGRDRILKGEELLAEVDWLVEAGTPAHEIASTLGKSRDNLERFAWRHSRPDLAAYLRERNAA
jgi:hypothetical protein